MWRISHRRCTFHVVGTASDMILATYRSRLLASSPTVSRSIFRHSFPIDSSGLLAIVNTVGSSTCRACTGLPTSCLYTSYLFKESHLVFVIAVRLSFLSETRRILYYYRKKKQRRSSSGLRVTHDVASPDGYLSPGGTGLLCGMNRSRHLYLPPERLRDRYVRAAERSLPARPRRFSLPPIRSVSYPSHAKSGPDSARRTT
jgi:hypothetical protein